MNRNVRQLFVPAVLLAAGFAAIFFLSNFNERVRPPLPADYGDRDLALQGAKLKGFALGLEGSLADWYWMQSLQYVGDKVLGAEKSGAEYNLENLTALNPRLLYPLLDNATDLDPKFIAAYSYGAIVLPAIDPAQAVALAEKGIRENPGEWRLHQHLGYIYWRLGDFEKAAETYEKGSQVPGAPAFFRLMTAQMKTQGGSRETARAMYRQMLDEAPDSQTREVAELRLFELDALDEREAIQAALARFREKNQRCAGSWAEILPLLRGVKLPGGRDFRVDQANNLVDPSGTPYLLDKTNCAVRIDSRTSKVPVR